MPLDDPILHHLRKIDGRLDRVEEEMREVKLRLASVETALLDLHGNVVHLTHRMDRFNDRLSRIDQRLEPREAEPA